MTTVPTGGMEMEMKMDLGSSDDPAFPLRYDLIRHLDDLRARTYEGAESRADREATFERAVQLLSPVVMTELDLTSARFLDGTGDVSYEPTGDDGAGGRGARWALSWPDQRRARDRSGGGLQPIWLIAKMTATNLHGHLSGSRAGDWPMQITSSSDAERQQPLLRIIIESELHQRIFDAGGDWRIVTTYARRRSASTSTNGESRPPV